MKERVEARDQAPIDGEAVQIDSPAAAIRLGIGMVHQHFMLVPVMTVAENIVLGQEPTQVGGMLDLRRKHCLVHAGAWHTLQ